MPWPEKEIRYELKENPVAKLYVATVKDEVVLGYIDFMITFDSATINRIAVNDLARRQGIGQALIDKMVRVCKAKRSGQLHHARGSSLQHGGPRALLKNEWKQVTIKKGYYDDGEDAIYMVRSILS
jgi:ribosomal-protein-alanine N-acetyltransferase